MKKLIIAAAVVAFAAVTQAAAFTWELTGASAYLGKDAYVFDANSRDAVIAALTAGGDTVADTVTGLAIGGPVQAAGRTGKEKFDGTGTFASDDPTSFSAFWILFDSTIADGNTYSISGNLDVTANVQKAGEGGKAAFSSTPGATFTTTGQMIGNVPEPTSAMLLLLGVAGLALRRKQK